MINVIIGKNCSLTNELNKKIKNCIIYSARDPNLIDKIRLISKKKINIIFNNFYPSRKISEVKPKDYNNFIRISLLSTTNVLNNLNPKYINKIIYNSSSSIYGFNKTNLKDSSNRKLASSFKILSENLIYNFCSQNNINFNILRIFNLYNGINDKFSILGKIFTSKKLQKKITINNNGESMRDFIHIKDVVKIISIILRKKTKHIVLDVGSGFGIKIKDILSFVKFPKKLIQFKKNNEEIDASIADTTNLFSEIKKIDFYPIEKFLKKEFNVKKIKNNNIIKTRYKPNYNNSGEYEYIIYGAGNAGKQIYNQLINNNEKVFCFVDDNPKLQETYYKNKKIISITDIEKLSLRKQINSIIISIADFDQIKLEKLKMRLKKICDNVIYLPTKKELISDKLSLNDTFSIGIEEIIGRRELNINKINPKIKNKTILVTGAAGSIGSELCRQIEFLDAKNVIALDNSEISLFNLKKIGLKKTKFILGDIKDNNLINNLIIKNKVSHIFHAAAYKHLNILENNIQSAITNNVIGTYYLLLNAIKNNCNFTLISTDKAVNPTSILGLTKRFAEIICVFFRKFNKKSNINIVRFGNVFGSVGSAVPTFIDQINKNKTITITDKNVSRYFMTIKEACFLVLETAKMKKQNLTFVLNMGKPVKIIKIINYLINLKKRINPYSKYKIKEIGLQKGEKVSEQLFISKNKLNKMNNNIFTVHEENYSKIKFEDILRNLIYFSEKNMPNPSINLIKKVLTKEIR
mgnify:CR=1 FL=1